MSEKKKKKKTYFLRKNLFQRTYVRIVVKIKSDGIIARYTNSDFCEEHQIYYFCQIQQKQFCSSHG
jgi:hypothetical protein